jgi:hypothetical protein
VVKRAGGSGAFFNVGKRFCNWNSAKVMGPVAKIPAQTDLSSLSKLMREFKAKFTPGRKPDVLYI